MLLVEAERSSRSVREFQRMASSCGICVGSEWLCVSWVRVITSHLVRHDGD